MRINKQNSIDNEILDSRLEAVKYKLAHRVTLLFTIIFGILASVHFTEDIGNFLVMCLGFLISSFSFVYNLVSKNYKAVYYIFSICGVVITSTTLNLLPTATHFGDFLWIFTSILLAFFGLNNKIGYVLLAIATIAIGIFTFHSVNINIVAQQPRTLPQQFSLFAEIIGALFSGMYIIHLIVDFYVFSEASLRENNALLMQQNDLIKSQDEEKTVLVKEIHHRVKNNLQIISSLLRMHSNEIINEESKKHFQEAIDRIMAMAMIHQKLYQGESLAKVNLQDYFEELVLELIRIYDDKQEVSHEISVQIEKIGLKSIVPLGLLVNELVSNSLKHAFTSTNSRKINLSIQKDQDKVIMHYADTGNWGNETKEGFGLELIGILIEQLEGENSVSKKETGTVYTIRFPKLEE